MKSKIETYVNIIHYLTEIIKDKDKIIVNLQQHQKSINTSWIEYILLKEQINDLNEKLTKVQSMNKIERILKENSEYKKRQDYLMTKIKGYEEIDKKYEELILENSALKAENYSLKNK